jgi:hypothetical protein
MARGPEGEFWKRVRRGWKGHSVRIEASDGEVEEGTPDTVLSVGGHGGFVELKVWPDNVSPQQLAWHMDALDRGAYAMVLAELPDGTVWLGRADDWDRLTREQAGFRIIRVSSPGPMLLHDALNVIACALNRR